MKNKENIKHINKLSISYIMLKGLNGQSLEKGNPFLTYLMYNMFMGGYDKKSKSPDINKMFYLIDVESGLGKTLNTIPNELFHMMIETSHDMYKNINDVKVAIVPNIDEQISEYLDEKDEFIDDLINNYRNSITHIMLNYNSNRKTYNEIKIDILTNEMNISVEEEDYNNAIIFRDKIKETKERIENKKRDE